jgi:hypothetical protein
VYTYVYRPSARPSWSEPRQRAPHAIFTHPSSAAAVCDTSLDDIVSQSAVALLGLLPTLLFVVIFLAIQSYYRTAGLKILGLNPLGELQRAV